MTTTRAISVTATVLYFMHIGVLSPYADRPLDGLKTTPDARGFRGKFKRLRTHRDHKRTIQGLRQLFARLARVDGTRFQPRIFVAQLSSLPGCSRDDTRKRSVQRQLFWGDKLEAISDMQEMPLTAKLASQSHDARDGMSFVDHEDPSSFLAR